MEKKNVEIFCCSRSLFFRRRKKKEKRNKTRNSHIVLVLSLFSFFSFSVARMQILVRVAVPATGAESGGRCNGSEDNVPPSTSSSSSPAALCFRHRTLTVDLPLSLHGGASSGSLPLAAVAVEALSAAGHPHAERALASGEWGARLVGIDDANGDIVDDNDDYDNSASSTSSSSLVLSIAPRLLGGKGGFGSLLRASMFLSLINE